MECDLGLEAPLSVCRSRRSNSLTICYMCFPCKWNIGLSYAALPIRSIYMVGQKQKVNKRNSRERENLRSTNLYVPSSPHAGARVSGPQMGCAGTRRVDEYGRRCRLRCACGDDWAVPGEDAVFPAFDILNGDTKDVTCLQSPLYKLMGWGGAAETVQFHWLTQAEAGMGGLGQAGTSYQPPKFLSYRDGCCGDLPYLNTTQPPRYLPRYVPSRRTSRPPGQPVSCCGRFGSNSTLRAVRLVAALHTTCA